MHCVTPYGTVSPVSDQQRAGDPFLSLRLPQAWIDALTALAAEAGCDRSTYLRRVLYREVLRGRVAPFPARGGTPAPNEKGAVTT